jgi:uncharacterized surface protein with fasciclin (FAS1) repeats
MAQTPSSKPAAAPAKEQPAHKEEPKKDMGKDIVDTAMASPDHKHFVEALKAADWVKPLKEAGPFTVFGPTDKAFEATGKWEEWMKPANKAALGNILQYHVIKGAKVMAADVMKMKESKPTVQGSTIKITVDKENKVWLNADTAHKAMVTKADISCSNGVIHVIDNVLMPPAKTDAKPEEKKGH